MYKIPWQDERGLDYLRAALCSPVGTKGVTERGDTKQQSSWKGQHWKLPWLCCWHSVSRFLHYRAGFSDLPHKSSYSSSQLTQQCKRGSFFHKIWLQVFLQAWFFYILKASACLCSLHAHCRTQRHADRTLCSGGTQLIHNLILLPPGTEEPRIIPSPAIPGTLSAAKEPQGGAH